MPKINVMLANIFIYSFHWYDTARTTGQNGNIGIMVLKLLRLFKKMLKPENVRVRRKAVKGKVK